MAEGKVIIAGLGNPGKEYRDTRHNIGFVLLDALCESLGLTWNTKSKVNAAIAEGNIGQTQAVLVKPLTFMNLSGAPIKQLCSFYRIEPSQVYIAHDDIELRNGLIKLKLGGGAAGHNGLRSINNSIGNNYWRIRIGVDRPVSGQEVSDYVLSKFTLEQKTELQTKIDLICTNIDLLLSNNVEDFRKILS